MLLLLMLLYSLLSPNREYVAISFKKNFMPNKIPIVPLASIMLGKFLSKLLYTYHLFQHQSVTQATLHLKVQIINNNRWGIQLDPTAEDHLLSSLSALPHRPPLRDILILTDNLWSCRPPTSKGLGVKNISKDGVAHFIGGSLKAVNHRTCV